MKKQQLIWIIVLLIVSSLACNFSALLPSQFEPNAEATSGAATLAALNAEQTAQANVSLPATETPQFGSINGKLSYPSEFIPPLRVVAINTGDNQAYYVDTVENQTTYQIDNLPPGNYHVIAYYAEMGLAGGYTQFVLCGLKAECTDHTLIDVNVAAGQVASEINPQDWYAPAEAFPPNPIP
jgi:hypothetical protein